MLSLSSELPAPDMRLYQGREEIFDPCRRKWVALTSEEWVRQRLIQQFTIELLIPTSLISVEKEIELNGLRKRYDLLVFDRDGMPWLMAECKSADIPLGTTVMEQLLRYHIRIPTTYLVISNGMETRCWQKSTDGLTACTSWPSLGK